MLGNDRCRTATKRSSCGLRGDCYTMDRGVQIGYEHQVPKVPSYGSRRVVAILREGQPRFKAEGADTGTPNASLEPPERWDYEKNGGRFGKIAKVDEGEGVYYSREHLCATGGHNQAQRGVSGSLERGAESVVVSRCSSKMREADGVSWLRYTSTRKQGAAALWRNLVTNGQPIRVFRSSKLANAWAPPLLNGKKEPAQYRHDGLYDVACMWDDAVIDLSKEPSQAPPGSRKGKKRKAPPSCRGPCDARRAARQPPGHCRRPRRPRSSRRLLLVLRGLRRRPRPCARTASRRCRRRRRRQRL